MGRPPINILVLVSSTQDSRFVRLLRFYSIRRLSEDTGISLRAVRNAYRTLFREQGITIASILTAIGMAIGVLVEAFLPGRCLSASRGGEPPPKDEASLKEWIRNKLKALASLLG